MLIKAKIFKIKLKYGLQSFSIHLISILLGFFAATILSTIPAQTGDWGIIGASMIVSFNEIISQIFYKNSYNAHILTLLNYIRIGIIYGLYVDAFKLGS